MSHPDRCPKCGEERRLETITDARGTHVYCQTCSWSLFEPLLPPSKCDVQGNPIDGP